jgi:hypothetical protein
MSRRATLRAAALCVVVLAGTGCGSRRSGTVDWPSWGNTAENTHFAEVAQVNTANVAGARRYGRPPSSRAARRRPPPER